MESLVGTRGWHQDDSSPLSPKGEPAVNWTFVQITTAGTRPGVIGDEPLQALERRTRGVQASRCPPPYAPTISSAAAWNSASG